jgi:hypothetical protein
MFSKGQKSVLAGIGAAVVIMLILLLLVPWVSSLYVMYNNWVQGVVSSLTKGGYHGNTGSISEVQITKNDGRLRRQTF